SAELKFQHESLAVDDVVKLIQQTLVDFPGMFQGSDTEALDALLAVLDLFVEAGWKEARALTHRLEDMYR
ncbi:MAG: hypothetical protein HW382_603, partial [Deltaproteobacteria bacterium]|nr:hypothetical protein [Deltaproteobacteria bacterium]